MQYGELAAELRKNKIGHLYLLAGEELYYIEKAKTAIIKSLFPQEDAMDLVEFLDEGAGYGDIITAIETVPFFSEKNLLIVSSEHLLRDKGSKEDKKGAQEIEKALCTLLGNIPEFTYVIFICKGKVDKRKRLYKALKEYGKIMEAEPLKAYNIGDWLEGKLQEYGLSMEGRAYEYFLAAVASMQNISLTYLDREIEKIALFLGERKRILYSDLLQALSDMPEISGFAMLNAIGERNCERALSLFRKQQETGVYFALTIGLLARQIRLWILALELSKKKINGRLLAEKLGQKPFIAERTLREAKGFSPGVLEKALLQLSDADYALKTGQGNMVELEYVIMLLCEKKRE